jgi:DNA-binding NarL/FixJ family response regulator
MPHHTGPKTAGSRQVAVVTGGAGPPRAAGRRGTARRRAVTTKVEVTTQEAQIARLAGEWLSNPEIGARPVLSPSTVQYRKVFTKLDITSRTQLDRVLSSC